MPDLSGKVALVTGATSGLGLETASALARMGAEVIIGVRNLEAGEKVIAEIRRQVPGAKVQLGPRLDLMSQDSVRTFAADINSRPGRLDILVNNAGAGFIKKSFTDQGVGILTQVNHLGPYTLTRLLEKKLVDAQGRIVWVASVTHRMSNIRDVKAFFSDFRSGLYEANKLANVLMAFELQRRLGNLGVTACAADPGAVASNIWTASPRYSKGFWKRVLSLYAPPSDGATAIVHAATVDWEQERRQRDGTPLLPAKDLRYYARGTMTWPLVTGGGGLAGKSAITKIRAQLWAVSLLVHTLIDWPLRSWSGGRFASKTKPVRAAKHAYNEAKAAELWDVSAEYANLPKQPQA